MWGTERARFLPHFLFIGGKLVYLKRIEIIGFKSFAEKTELEISPGITAVVGPNGSGKSNIVDAIRWVLGEQSSKSLRGSKMEDVIFAGSQSRKPLNYSEVSLTLDNEKRTLPLDFAEVTLTRRLDRSGESHYYINRQPCRLKDITDLLLDTGLGKEAYSIIGQGRIDEILSNRPEDRRGIFEETAGIVRYRLRRREAEKHLAETEQNLSRINDILHELSQQLAPLRQQAEMARRYKEIRRQLKNVEVSLYLARIQDVHAAWQDANRSLETAQQAIEAARRRLAGEDEQLAALRQRMQELENEIDQLHRELLHTTGEIKRLDGLREVLRERQRQLAAQKRQAEESMQKSTRQLTELEARIQHVRSAMEETNRTYEDVRHQLHAAQARLQQVQAAAANEKEMSEQLKNEYFEQSNRLAQWRNEERFHQQSLETGRKRQERLQRELDELAAAEEVLAQEVQRISNELHKLAESEAEKKQAYRFAETRAEQQRASMEATRRLLERLQQDISQLRSKHEVIKEMEREFAGYAQGVKAILQARNKKWLSGVHGAVAELIRVPRELEAAVEAALGGALQHIVVDDEAIGRQCIAFLKERRAGRATFLPLDVVGKARLNKEPTLPDVMPGLIGFAHRLVQADETYQAVLTHLLGQVLVAEDLEAANHIARKTGYRLRVVTLDGDLVNVGGSMTGGSTLARKMSLLGRQRELAELAAAMEKLATEERSARQRLEEQNSVLKQLEKSMLALQEEASTLVQQRQRLELEQQRLADESARYSQRRAVLEEERRQLAEEIRMTEERRRDVATRIRHASEQAAAIRGKIETLQGAERQWAQETAVLSEQIGRLRTETARLEQQRQHFTEQLEELLKIQSEQLAEADLWRRRIKQLEQNTVEAMKEEEAADKERQAFLQRVQAVEDALASKQNEKSMLDGMLNDAEKRRRQAQGNLQQAEEEGKRMAVLANRREVELDHLLTSLSRDWGMSYEWAKTHYPLPADVAQAEGEVERLKREMQQLGDVNLGAIEEYERIHERYRFLSNQQADLLAAKATLQQAIAELDEKIAVRFQTAFAAIRRHFQELFADMFGGGQADLVLTAPDDLLHTGVDIVVQPPGKRMQPLNLLSGGERAMTAIVLLFAMLQTRPAPFCILDEVDAALDDVNVSRFARQLRRFAQESQFLVITHRQGTMEEADVLYGVAMQEAGVSEVFSLSMTEAARRYADGRSLQTGS